MSSEPKHIVGVDVGATRVRVCLYVHDRVVYKVEASTAEKLAETGRPSDRYALYEAVRGMIDYVLRAFRVDVRMVKGIGVGSIGPLDIRRGIIRSSPNLPYKVDYELLRPLREYYNVKTIVVNDCVAAVWGEVMFGAGRGRSNVVYITFSTGIGGGVVVDGNLLIGRSGNAHEIGHITVDLSDDALTCGCGGRGHWEAYCSGTGIPKYVSKLLSELPREDVERSLLSRYERIEARHVFEAARLGDRVAVQVINKILEVNAIGIANVIHSYDPEVIAVGGSIALRNKDLFLRGVTAHLSKYLMRGVEPPEIVYTELEDDAVLMGAVALILRTPRRVEELQCY